MELVLKTIFVTILFINSGCDAGKSAASEQSKENIRQTTEQDYSADGYTRVRITGTKSSDCPFVLAIENSEEKLDPVNLDEEKFSSYRKDGELIWIKYRRLRRANRCPDANPIEIIEVKQ